MLRPVPLAMVVALLAGCAAPGGPSGEERTEATDQENDSPPVADGDPRDEIAQNFRATECALVDLQSHTTREKAEPWLPPGFVLETPGDIAPAFSVLHTKCLKVVFDNGSEIEAYSQTVLGVFAIPPDDLAPPEGYRTLVLINLWVEAPEMMPFLMLKGLASDMGKAGWDLEEVLPSEVAQLTGGLQSEDANENWEFSVLADESLNPNAFSTRIFYPRSEGVGFYDFVFNGRGFGQSFAGAITAQEGSLLGQLYTAGPAPVICNYGEAGAIEFEFGG